jgi:hypothetical protein
MWARVALILLGGNSSASGSSGGGGAFTPAMKFNDVGGSGGGDRNSMYAPFV